MKKPIEGKDFGFIAPDDQQPGGKDMFFHKDSLAEGVVMGDLKEGDRLSYNEEAAERGPRAVNVKKI